MSAFARAAEPAVLLYFALFNAAQLAFFFFAFRAARRASRERVYPDLGALFSNPLVPPVSVLVRAGPAATGVVEAATALLQMNYPRFEVVVVAEGEAALAELKAALKLAPVPPEEAVPLKTGRVRGVLGSRTYDTLTVLDKEPGGRGDALNAALNVAQHPYFLAVDAEDRLEPDALLRLVREMLEAPARPVAVGGAVRAANGGRFEKGKLAALGLGTNPWPVFQTVEAFRDVVAPAYALSGANGVMSLSGACALYERDLVVAMGGFPPASDGEDWEFLLRLHRRLRDDGEREYAVRFVPEPVCWSRLPDTLAALARRKRRRQSGLLGSLGRSRGLFFETRYGALGSFTAPFLFVFEGWGVLFEALGYVLFAASLLRGGWGFAASFFGLVVAGGAALSVAGVILGEACYPRYPSLGQLAGLAVAALAEGFCYRPLSTALRLAGTADHLRGGDPLPGAGADAPSGLH
ncbi:glycosyltransferase family 2 protein [bacterium]|nr:MAG: glycosyltransferase family 2 protein [bacterium]